MVNMIMKMKMKQFFLKQKGQRLVGGTRVSHSHLSSVGRGLRRTYKQENDQQDPDICPLGL